MRTITKTGGIGLETVMEKYPQATEPNDRGVDLLLQKTDQSAHVPFKHEFKVGSMSLQVWRQVSGYAHE